MMTSDDGNDNYKIIAEVHKLFYISDDSSVNLSLTPDVITQGPAIRPITL